MQAVSNVIPRKVRQVDGPSIFSEANGMPRLVHSCMKVLRFWWHCGEWGVLRVGNHPGSGESVRYFAAGKSKITSLPKY